MPTADLTSLLEGAEAAAFAELNAACPAVLAQQLGLRTHHLGGATAFVATRIPTILFNRALNLGLHRPATPDDVAEVLDVYRSAGVAKFALQLVPTARPAALPDWLLAHHLRRADNWTKVWREAAVPPPVIATTLQVSRIGPAQAADFVTVLLRGFGMPDVLAPWIGAAVGRPDWHHYVAYLDDEPVAAGALFVRDGVGWLGMGATVPEHRRRGGQGALMARRIRDGLDLGCRYLATETGEDLPARPNPSFHNMVRTGFQVGYQRTNYLA